VHIVAAVVNWEEFWLMLNGMLTWTLLFGNVGSGTAVGYSGQEPLELLYGRPAGISFWQVASALLYWGEFVSMSVRLLKETVPFWKVGSGKSWTPCKRIHAAALM
jgi:hypothetical protein